MNILKYRKVQKNEQNPSSPKGPYAPKLIQDQRILDQANY